MLFACENKGADELRDYLAADQCLCFHHIDKIVQSLLLPKFQASNPFLWRYSLGCVRPGFRGVLVFQFSSNTHLSGLCGISGPL